MQPTNFGQSTGCALHNQLIEVDGLNKKWLTMLRVNGKVILAMRKIFCLGLFCSLCFPGNTLKNLMQLGLEWAKVVITELNLRRRMIRRSQMTTGSLTKQAAADGAQSLSSTITFYDNNTS